MKSGRNVVGAIAALGVFAWAQPGRADETSYQHDWTGFHVGALAGYVWNDGGVSVEPANFDASYYFIFNLMPGNPIGSSKGEAFGGEIGYDIQTGLFVYGVAADLSYTRVKDSSASESYLLVTNASKAERELETFGTLRARLGVTPFDQSLVYVTGGLAFGRASLSNSIELLDVNRDPICGSATGLCASASTTKWLTGWTLGGGWEQAFSANWSAKIEGLYYDLGSITQTFEDATAMPSHDPLFRSSADIKGKILRVGVSYKFD